MNDETKPRKRGRPKSNNPMVRMPEMLVKPERLEAYKESAAHEGKTFSEWVRNAMDRASKK